MKPLAKTSTTLCNTHTHTYTHRCSRPHPSSHEMWIWERKKCLPTMEIHETKTRKVPYLTIQIYSPSIHMHYTYTYIHVWNDGPKGFSSKHITPIKFSVDDDRFLFVISWEPCAQRDANGYGTAAQSRSRSVCALSNCQCSFSLFIKMRCKYYIHAHKINARTLARI